MDSKDQNLKIDRLPGIYNLAVNLFWSVVNLTPLVIFCYQFMSWELAALHQAAINVYPQIMTQLTTSAHFLF